MNKKFSVFSKSNKRVTSLLKYIAGILILALLIYKVGFKQVISTFLEVNWFILFFAIITAIISLIVGNFNLYILLKPTYKSINFWRLFKYYIISWYISFFAPGRTGTTSIIYLLRKEKIKIGESSALFILDKIMTFSWMFVLSIPSFFIFLTITQSLILISLLTILSIIVLYLIFSKHGRYIIKRFILRKYSDKFSGFSKILARYLKRERKTLILNYTATIIRWCLDSLTLFIIFLSFGRYINFSFIFIVRAVITIIAMVPLTANGLGIKEGLALFFFSKVYPNKSVILGAYLIALVLDYLIVFFFFSLPGAQSIFKRRLKNE